MAILVLTAGLLLQTHRRAASPFLYWYVLGLLLLATGLAGSLGVAVRESPLQWVTRLTQVIATVYLCAVGIASMRKSGVWQISLEAAWGESEQRYRTLFTSLQEGFYLAQVICDGEGKPCDMTYLDANPAFERIMGLRRDQIRWPPGQGTSPGDEPRLVESVRSGADNRRAGERSLESYSEQFQKHFEAIVFRPRRRGSSPGWSPTSPHASGLRRVA